MNHDKVFEKYPRGEFVANNIRAGGEPILKSHFGEEISDDLFARFANKVIDCMAREKRQYLNLVISLTKKAWIFIYKVYAYGLGTYAFHVCAWEVFFFNKSIQRSW